MIRRAEGSTGIPCSVMAQRGVCRLIGLFFILIALVWDSGEGQASHMSLLFEDDFSGSAIGEFPPQWSVWPPIGNVQVVQDPEAAGGQVVRLLGHPERTTRMRVTLPTEDPIVVVEYSLRWVKGFGLHYLLDYADRYFGKHNLNWFIDEDGNLVYRFTGLERRTTDTLVVGPLQEGWNRVRVVADLEEKETYVFLNESFGIGPLPFWHAIDNWNLVRFTIHDHGRWSLTDHISETESYYDDVKVWTVSSDQASDFRRDIRGEAFTSTWIEYWDVARRPLDWWQTGEARALGERIVGHIQSGRLHIDIPVQLLTVPDGILSTQLMALAQLYAATGEVRFKTAFIDGLETLLEAQFPSGLWPTVYPDDKDYDMLKDKYASASWDSIPALFNAIIEGITPFHTDIADSIDPSRLQAAMDRVPPRHMIMNYFEVAQFENRESTWWASEEARRIGDNLLSWQMDHGGWERIQGMAYMPFSPELGHKHRGTPFGDGVERGDFLGGRTTEPMRYLARLYVATGEKRYLESFNRGLEFVLTAQYPSGGWPRHYPLVGTDPEASPFNNAVTFYTDAMVTTMKFIEDVVAGTFPFEFVDDSYIPRLETAFQKGIDYILKAQIVVDDRPTAWGQRHNPIHYNPVQGRAFELVAINPWISVGIIRLLQSIPEPSAEVRQAILYALEYLESVQLLDGRWAMFYEIGTNRPIFAGNDGVKRYSMEEIDLARQLKYPWYGIWPESLLAEVKSSGYLEALYQSLPHHPTVRVRFISVGDGEKIHGSVPINIELLQPLHSQFLEQVTIDVDGVVIYNSSSIPAREQLVFDSEKVEDGRRLLTVTMVHNQLGTFRQTIHLIVQNRWKLVVNPGPDQYAYFEDFSSFEVGGPPTTADGWIVSDGGGQLGVVEIVEAVELESNRALKMTSELVGNRNFTVSAPVWNLSDENVSVISAEYKVRLIQGTGINAYVDQGSSHKVVMGVGGGHLTYSDGTWHNLATMEDGWNTVRVVANREKNTADFYLNEVLVGRNTSLRNEVDSWLNTRFRFLVATSSTQVKEITFSDLKAWPVIQGWSGASELLEGMIQSDGWMYLTDDGESFWGSVRRLARATEAEQFLLWETPRLQSVNIQLFVGPCLNFDVKDGVELAVSADGRTWKPVNYELTVDYNSAEQSGCRRTWRSMRITLDTKEETNHNWLRLTLTDALPRVALQIGEVVLEGLRP